MHLFSRWVAWKQRKAKYILAEIIVHVLVKDNLPPYAQLWFISVTIST